MKFVLNLNQTYTGFLPFLMKASYISNQWFSKEN
jgi:hypothetical protein